MTVAEGDEIELWGRKATVVNVLPSQVHVRFGEGQRRKPIERTLIEDPTECAECGADAEHIVRHNPPTGAYREGYCDEHVDASGHYSSLEGSA
jgi:hypothetical protein